MQTYHGAKRANIISCKYNYSGRNQRQEGRKQLHTLSYYTGENEHKIQSCGELEAERLGYASSFGSRSLVVNELYKFKKTETNSHMSSDGRAGIDPLIGINFLLTSQST